MLKKFNLIALMMTMALSFVIVSCGISADDVVDDLVDAALDAAIDQYSDDMDKQIIKDAVKSKLGDYVGEADTAASAQDAAAAKLSASQDKQNPDDQCENYEGCGEIYVCVADGLDRATGLGTVETYMTPDPPQTCTLGWNGVSIEITVKEFGGSMTVSQDAANADLKTVDWTGKVVAESNKPKLGAPGMNFQINAATATVNQATKELIDLDLNIVFSKFSPKTNVLAVEVALDAELTEEGHQTISGSATRDGKPALTFTFDTVEKDFTTWYDPDIASELQ